MSSENPNTRTRILDTAWRLLEDGRPVRMSDIAKAVGISRQALYLHFPGRAELLIAVTRHVDEVLEVDARLAESRAAARGTDRLAAFIGAWGGYIPEIQGVGRALMAMQAGDAEARAAWSGRMQAMREGCEAAVAALAADGDLRDGLDPATATDLLWTLLSVENWLRLREECGWSQDRYMAVIRQLCHDTLVAGGRFL